MKIDAYVVDHVNAPFVREELELEDPGPGELLIRIVGTGICHTDVNTQTGDMPLPLPGVLGHEGSGIVEAIGQGVTQASVGDRVIIGWPYCGECKNCIRGEHRYCERIGEALVGGHRLRGPKAGTSAYQRNDGQSISGHFFGQSSFATYSIVHETSVVVVDQDVPLEYLGPLACGIATGAGAVFNTAAPRPGDSIVVFGVGAVIRPSGRG
jgi:aryl-alcohol dehydrogenase